MLLNNGISIETYIKYSIKVFDFAKLEKKAKMFEDGDDKESADSLRKMMKMSLILMNKNKFYL